MCIEVIVCYIIVVFLRHGVELELISVLVQQAYHKVTIRQLSLMLRQLERVWLLPEVVSL